MAQPGQGGQRPRTALHAAGAHYVLTSLWKVGDAPTRELMADFYRRMWVEGVAPRAALWQAKTSLRSKPGTTLADWAGWVLTGIGAAGPR